MIRAFVAFDLDEASLDALERLGEALRATQPATKQRTDPAKWTTRAQMHVTAKFLGSTSEAQAESLRAALASLAGQVAPPARVEAIAAFPNAGRASVLIAPAKDDAGGLARVAAAIDEHAATLGFPRETRAYMPHATFARLRVALDARAWIERIPVAPFDLRITALTLYESRLSSSGARYTPLARAAY